MGLLSNFDAMPSKSYFVIDFKSLTSKATSKLPEVPKAEPAKKVLPKAVTPPWKVAPVEKCDF